MEISPNWVRIAVDRIGGPTKAAATLAVSATSVHHWINHQRVPDIDKASCLANLAGLDVQQLRSVP